MKFSFTEDGLVRNEYSQAGCDGISVSIQSKAGAEKSLVELLDALGVDGEERDYHMAALRALLQSRP
jgi:hypothetical protein